MRARATGEGALPFLVVTSALTPATLAVDIGGVKLSAGEVTETGRLVRRTSLSTPSTSSDQELFEALAGLLEPYRPFGRFRVCGVGCGGVMTAGGELVSPPEIPAWRSFPLRERLEKLTGLPVAVDNNAKAMTLAEGWVGAARDTASFLGVTLCHCIGGGIVLNRRLLDGGTGNAGHIGQMMAAMPARPIPEAVADLIPGSMEGSLAAEVSGSVIQARTGRLAIEATTAEIADFGTTVGRVVGSVANLLDLRRVILGGSVALGFGEPFFAAVAAEADRVCRLDYTRGIRIEASGCGDEGPLVGAAAIGLRSLGKKPGGIA